MTPCPYVQGEGSESALETTTGCCRSQKWGLLCPDKAPDTQSVLEIVNTSESMSLNLEKGELLAKGLGPRSRAALNLSPFILLPQPSCYSLPQKHHLERDFQFRTCHGSQEAGSGSQVRNDIGRWGKELKSYVRGPESGMGLSSEELQWPRCGTSKPSPTTSPCDRGVSTDSLLSAVFLASRRRLVLRASSQVDLSQVCCPGRCWKGGTPGENQCLIVADSCT